MDWTDPECTAEQIYALFFRFEKAQCSQEELRQKLTTLLQNPAFPLLILEDPMLGRVVECYRERPKLPRARGGVFTERWPEEWVERVFERALDRSKEPPEEP